MSTALASPEGTVFSKQQAIDWFAKNYPKIKTGTITAHLIRLSINAPSRTHYFAKPGEDDVFFQVDGSHFRLYQPAQDPSPIYTAPGAAKITQTRPNGRTHGRTRRQGVMDNRVDMLIRDFERYVFAFDEKPAFTRSGQFENHEKTIKLRFELGSASAALQSSDFLDCLRNTLLSWGIGSRASRLVEFEQFGEVLQRHVFAISELEHKHLDAPGLRVQLIADKVWAIINGLDIVENEAKLVPCTKALHHLLPELIVPMDREYTGTFFGLQGPNFQYRQDKIFHDAFERFAAIAKSANPRQYIGSGWRTSVTKVIDNAIVAFCRIEDLSSPSRGSLGPRMSNKAAQTKGAGKAKGQKGESCAQALQNSLQSGEVVNFTDLFERVKAKGSWSDDTISLHLMACVVNLPPARRRWPSTKPFLFLRPDGRYELWDERKHPSILE